MTIKIIPATLLADFYKISHRMFYPAGTTEIYSTWIPRSAEYFPIETDYAVAKGFQMFNKKYLVDYFNKNFFGRPKAEIIAEYEYVIKNTLGGVVDSSHIAALHDLGYLPLEIKTLPEGTKTPIKVPTLTIVNTLPEFYWLTNYFETIMSSELWLPSNSATIAAQYRDLLDGWALETIGSTDGVEFQGHDFSFRGMQGLDSAVASGLGHLLSFTGTDNIPAIVAAEVYYGADLSKELVGTSVPACYDDITEILTNEGFKLFSDLKDDDLVAQYHEDGTITFVKPTAYYNMPYKGEMVHFETPDSNNIDIMVTPNHRMVKLNPGTKNVEIFEAGDKKRNYSNKNRIIVSGILNNPSAVKSHLDDLDILRIAFQADGSFMNRKESYTGARTGLLPIRFSLKKDRKKDRLVQILKNLGWEYTLNQYEDGYYSFYIKCPIEMQKDFDWIDLSEISPQWCKEFIEELPNWDGKVATERDNNIGYATIEKKNADKIQAIAHLCNMKATIALHEDKRDDYERKTLYTQNINMERTNLYGHSVKRNFVEDYDSTVHCVSVPTRMLVVRRNNRVAVSGNTEHSIMSSFGRDEVKAFSTIIDSVPEGIVSIVSDTYDFWNVLETVLPTLKEKIMSRNGKVVIRPDSGNPIDIICGTYHYDLVFTSPDSDNPSTLQDFAPQIADYFEANFVYKLDLGQRGYLGIKLDEKVFAVHYDYDGTVYNIDVDAAEEVVLTPVQKGAIQLLWETFAGTISKKGYKLLSDKVGLLYGDAITIKRADEISAKLAHNGFASTNVVYGIGSFTYSYVTRDSLGYALKSTYAMINGKETFIEKDPKTDDKNLKKSLTGKVAVVKGEDGVLKYVDHLTAAEEKDYPGNLLRTIFKNGEIENEITFAEMKKNLHG